MANLRGIRGEIKTKANKKLCICNCGDLGILLFFCKICNHLHNEIFTSCSSLYIKIRYGLIHAWPLVKYQSVEAIALYLRISSKRKKNNCKGISDTKTNWSSMWQITGGINLKQGMSRTRSGDLSIVRRP